MFHSHSLSRKGPLGSVWVAAYCHKRLKKAEVTATDISFSVDKILQDEFEIITYRVLGYFLLGVVRIYSKKVEYLFNDCHKVLVQVKGFVVSEKGHSRTVKGLREPISLITRPKRFELDAFDLEVGDDVSGAHHQSPQEEITLKDNAWRHAGMVQCALQKYNWEKEAGCHDTLIIDYTEAEDIVPLAFIDTETEASVEKPQDTLLSQELCVGLLTFEDHQSRPLNEDNQGELEQMRSSEGAHLSEKDKCFSEEEDFDLSNLEFTIERIYEDGKPEIGNASFEVVAPSGGDKCLFSEKEGDLSNLETTIQKLQEDGGFEKGDADSEIVAPLDGENQVAPSGGDKCLVSEKEHDLSNSETTIDKLREAGRFDKGDADFEMAAPLDGETQDAPSGGDKCLVSEKERDLSNLVTTIERLREDGGFEKEDADSEMAAPLNGETGEVIGTETKVDFAPEETYMPSEIVSSDSPEPDVVMTDRPISLRVDSTPAKKPPITAEGGLTPEFMLVPTPALKERRLTKRKRKCLFDDLIVLPNDLVKKSIRDASDLVCKRRKAPCNAFTVWKATRALGFSEPLIPYSSSELQSLLFLKNLKISAPHEDVVVSAPGEDVVVPAAHEDVELPAPNEDVKISAAREDVEVPEKVIVSELPPGDGSSEQAGIAPETPTRQFSSRRPYESPKASKSDEVRPESPLESVALEKESSVYEDQDLSFTLMNEDLNSLEGETHKLYGWTGRTRQVAKHLNEVFQKQKGKDEVTCLLQISKGRTRKESARLFYEILVLKSNGFINVDQETAHADVLIRKLPKLEQAFDADDSERRT
ncbi:sister chromatid cohesion 1 protein 2 isoform X2 [Punica granatum]|uniref:Sister chromatid cohesion 1 protein 2 isoform X2 n=1 Tax=Punica granatum TaxID=22663 RepID=A0A6P8E1S5_PUNGR|nr:sister chromatid cohesion 1 protein 2 isoform X2 [Punica granatum]